MKSRYLSTEQLQQIIEQQLTPAARALGLSVDREKFAEVVDAVIAGYVATFPRPPETLLAEVHLLEEVCSWYANDEDRYLNEDGEPYGSFPTEVGLKARSARKRFQQREAEEAAKKFDGAG